MVPSPQDLGLSDWMVRMSETVYMWGSMLMLTMTSDQTVYVDVMELSKFEFLVGIDPTNHQKYSACVDGCDFACQCQLTELGWQSHHKEKCLFHRLVQVTVFHFAHVSNTNIEC